MRSFSWIIVVLFAFCSLVVAEENVPSAENTQSTAQVLQEKMDAANTAMGLPLLQPGLWTDVLSPDDYAQKLDLPFLDSTSYCGIYQKYCGKDITLFGRRVYYMALYTREKKPYYLYIVLGNVGDMPNDNSLGARRSGGIRPIILEDYQSVGKGLTQLFGKPREQKLGNSHTVAEDTLCWVFEDIAFVLSCPRQKAVILRVMPLAMVKDLAEFHQMQKVGRRELKKRILKNDLGDQLLDILMVDQGGKGYCVPATFERYLRNYGINAEMYSLAITLKSGWGGGTSIDDDVKNVFKGYARGVKGLKVKDNRRKKNSFGNIRKSILKGEPVLCYIFSNPQFNTLSMQFTQERAKYDNVKKWKAQLKKMQKNRWAGADQGAHSIMLIGVNDETEEVGFTDSWGEAYKVRWIPYRLLKQAMQGPYGTIEITLN